MKKYKLLKDLPGIKVGTIIIEDDDGDYLFESGTKVHSDYYDILSRIFHSSYQDFFEEIIKKKTFDTLTDEDKVFFIDTNGDIDTTFYRKSYCKSEVFITREEAEDEHKRREWSNRKDKFVPKIGDEYYCYLSMIDSISTRIYGGHSIVNLEVNSGLVFRTSQECQDAIDNHDIVRLFYTIR